MENAMNALKRKFEEDPVTVILVTSAAVAATAKLIDSLASARNTRTWAKEVDRRNKMN